MRLASLREQPHSSYHSMARIDGSKRSVGLPSRRLRPALAASAVALRRVASREAPRLPEPAALGCSVDNSRARRRMLLRAARCLCRSLRSRAPHLDAAKTHRCHVGPRPILPLRPKEGT